MAGLSSYEDGYQLYRGPDFKGPWTEIADFNATPRNTGVMGFVDDDGSIDFNITSEQDNDNNLHLQNPNIVFGGLLSAKTGF